MRARSSFIFCVALLAAWVLALVPRAAYAQTTPVAGPSVTGVLGVVSRFEPPPNSTVNADDSGQNPHPSGVLANVVNFADCEADLAYGFELGISSLNNSYNLNIWAGTQDCSQLANRQAATAVCWPVISPVLVTSNPFTTKVRMRDIVSQAALTTHVVTYAGAPTIQTNANPPLCQAQTVTGASAISLYFFFADTGGNAVGSEATYAVTLDTRAGNVQGNISVGLGDGLLIVNIPPTTDTDTQGFNVYCDPPPGQDASNETVPIDAATNNGVCATPVVDAAPVASVDSSGIDDGSSEASSDSSVAVDSAVPVVLDDAGGNACGIPLNDAGIPSPGGCTTSSVLVPGGTTSSTVESLNEAGVEVFSEAGSTTVDEEAGVPATGNQVLTPSKYLCASGGVGSTKVVIKNITNGVYYNILVGETDAAGNVGPLSNAACGFGAPVDDFLKNYYNDGGRAGGGFCSTEGAGTPAGTGGLGALMVASMVAIVRRRRRK